MVMAKSTIGFWTLVLLALMAILAQQAIDVAFPATHRWHSPVSRIPIKMQVAARPANFCTDRYARIAGRLISIEAQLKVAAAQRPLLANWRNAVLHNEQRRRTDCLTHGHRAMGNVSVVERSARMQEQLEERLAALRLEEPSLEILYQSLTPAQKVQFDRYASSFDDRNNNPAFFRDSRGG